MVETTEETENFPMTEDSKHPTIDICTYNIISGGNARLEAAMRTMRMMHMDLGILTETKLVEGFHTTKCEGYDIVATKARNHHQGGVLLFYKTSKHWHVEGTKTYGPNVIRTELVSGSKRWIIIGAYIPPSETDGTTLGWLQKATTVATTHPLILLGDLNVNFYQTPAGGFNERQEETLALVASLGLTDLSRHFTQRIGWKDWTWSSKRPDGHHDRSVCDYILVQERAHFQNFKIKQP
jgi:exonuclease III